MALIIITTIIIIKICLYIFCKHCKNSKLKHLPLIYIAKMFSINPTDNNVIKMFAF